MTKRVHYVLQTDCGEWKVQKTGVKRASAVTEDKAAAIQQACRLASIQPPGHVVIHKGQRSIQRVGGMYHVIQDRQEGWRVIRSGASRATLVAATKQEAVEGAHKIAKKHSADIYIHKKDGTISRVDSYQAVTHRFLKSR